MDNKMNTQELISALADGQLQGEALARGLDAAVSQPAAAEAWRNYHLIGDVLRSPDLAAGTAPETFLARLRQGLKQEQPLAARPAMRPIEVLQPAAALDLRRPAANDASQRWKLVAGFASVAAVAAIGWTVLGAVGGKAEGPLLAGTQSAAPVLARSGGETMIRDARLDQLMAAHRQFGGATALQAPAGFLRSATFEGPAR